MEETRDGETNRMGETREIETNMMQSLETGDTPNQKPDLQAARKHFSRLGLMFLLGIIAIYAVEYIPILIVRYLRPEWLKDININLSLALIPQYLIGMPIMIALVKRVPADKVEQHHMKAGHFALAVIMCFALMYSSNIIGQVITAIIGQLKGGEVENVTLDLISSLSIFWLFFYTVICAPIMEEYIFRKLIVDRTVRYGQATAVVMSGLMFGLFHGNLNQFIYTFTLGAFLAFLYVKTGKLKFTIAIHMMVNFMGGVFGSLVLNLIDMDEYMRVAQSKDIDAMMNFVMNNIVGLLLSFFFIFFIFGMLIAGGILLIVSLGKRRFTFAPGEVVIPKGMRFRTVILNVGMVLFCLFWVVSIVAQLFA